MKRIAIIFENYGPYHIARLTAVAACMDLLGIEVYRNSKDYAWVPADQVPFRRKTLFNQREPRLVNSREISARLSEIFNNWRPDALAIPGWGARESVIAARVALKFRIPIVLMSDTQDRDFPRVWWKEWIKSQYVSLAGSALVGGTPHREYLHKLGIPEGSIWDGYDVVDNVYFSKYSDECRKYAGSLRKNYRLPKSYFLVSARFVEKKNLFRLIDAYGVYRRRCRVASHGRKGAWDLVILGDGPLREKIEKHIESSGLYHHVQLAGFVQYPELPIYYGLAGCFILPSTTEQWGLVVNEAMASGLPVLVSRHCGCAQDLVEEGINGFVFDPYDIGEMAVLMQRISSDREALFRMGHKSREIIAQWSPQRFARNLELAANKACSVEPQKLTIVSRMLLWMMACQ